MIPEIRSLLLSFPYPLSRVGLEAFTLIDRWEADEPGVNLPLSICRIAGLLIRIDAAVAIASLIASGKLLPELNTTVIQVLRNPTDGGWRGLSQRIINGLNSEIPLFLALQTALMSKQDVIVTVLPEAGQGINKIVGAESNTAILLSELLAHLVSYRNKVAHGERLNKKAHFEAAVKLKAAVAGHAFYRDFVLLCRQGSIWSDCSGPSIRKIGSGHQPAWWTPSFKEILDDTPERQLVFVNKLDPRAQLKVSPLLHYVVEGDGQIRFDDLFFVNKCTVEAVEYISYRTPGHLAGRDLGILEEFRDVIKKLPVPLIPSEKRLAFDNLAEFHAQRFAGREEVLEEIDRILREAKRPYVEIRALAGMGKTALFAHLYKLHGGRENLPWPAISGKRLDPPEPLPWNHDRWLFHFCSSTEGRNDPRVVLQSLVCQLCDGAGFVRQTYLASEVEEQRRCFARCLAKVNERLEGNARIFVCLDALDEGFPTYGKHTVPGVLFGQEDVSDQSDLAQNIVFLVSYRVDEQGLSRVDDHLKHIPDEWKIRLANANPLKGLARDEVRSILLRLASQIEAEEVPESFTEAVWLAATHDYGTQQNADPFYLRFLGDGILEKTVDFFRPESVPSNLGTVFEQMWMCLTTEHNYALHYMLATLAILREHGSDELIAHVLNHRRGQCGLIERDELQVLRLQVSKFLIYDGDRYSLFHDRFRWFLIGQHGDNATDYVKRIRKKYGELDFSGRLAPTEVTALHMAMGEISNESACASIPESVREYALHYGPHHLIMAGKIAQAIAQLTDYSTCSRRLKKNRSDEWVEDLILCRHVLNAQTRDVHGKTLFMWEEFARRNKHVLQTGDEEWPAHRILFQLAIDHGEGSPIAMAAEKWAAVDSEEFLCLRRLNRIESPSDIGLVLSLDNEGAYSIKLHPDGRRLISGGWEPECAIKIWDLAVGKCLAVLHGHQGSIIDILFHPDGIRIISSSEDKTLRLWSIQEKKCLAVFSGHEEFITCVALHPDGRRIISSSEDKTIRIWDIDTGICEFILTAHEEIVSVLMIHPDGKKIISGGYDKTLRIWDIDSGKCLATLKSDFFIADALIHKNGRTIISFDHDSVFQIWDIESADDPESFVYEDDKRKRVMLPSVVFGEDYGDQYLQLDSPELVAIIPERNALLINFIDHAILFDINPGSNRFSEIKKFNYRGNCLFKNSVKLFADGKCIAACTSNIPSKIDIFDIETGERIKGLGNLRSNCHTCLVHPDKNTLITNNLDIFNLDAEREQRQGTAHSGNVSALQSHLNGIDVISGGGDGAIGIWRENSCTLTGFYEDFCIGNITKLLVNPKNLNIIAGCEDGTVAIFDQESEKVFWLGVINTDAEINSIAINPEGSIIALGRTRGIELWNVDKLRYESTISGYAGEVFAVVIHPDGRRLLSACEDSTVKIWDLFSGECMAILTGHEEGGVLDVVLHSDGQRMLSGGDDCQLKLWNLVSGECINTINTGHKIESVSFSFDGNKAFTTGWGGIKVWDLDLGKCLKKLDVGFHTVTAAAVHPDGRRVVSGRQDGVVRVWDVVNGRNLRELVGHTKPIRKIVIHPDGRQVMSVETHGKAKIWDLESGLCKFTLESHGVSFLSGAIHPEGNRCILGCVNSKPQVWDLETGTLIAEPEGHKGAVTSMILHPDGRRLITGSSGIVKVWDLETQACLSTFPGHEDEVTSLLLHPDGDKLISAVSCGGIRMWSLDSNKCLYTICSDAGCVLIDSRGQTIVSGGLDNTVRLFDITNGNLLRTMVGHESNVEAMALLPDDHSLVAGDEAGAIKVWNLISGDCIFTKQAHENSVFHLILDEKRLITCGYDLKIKIWNLSDLTLLSQYNIDTFPYSPDSFIISFSGKIIYGDNFGNIIFLEQLPVSSVNSVKLLEDFLCEETNNFDLQVKLSQHHENIGDFCLDSEDFDGAILAYRSAIEAADRFLKQNSEEMCWEGVILKQHKNIGIIYQIQGKFIDATSEYKKALEILKKIKEQHCSDPVWFNSYAEIVIRLGTIFQEQNRLEEALEYFEASIPLLKKAMLIDKDNSEHPHLLSLAYEHAWSIHWDLGDAINTENYARKALSLRESWLNHEHPDLARSLFQLGKTLKATERMKEAESLLQRALSIQETALIPGHPETTITIETLADTYYELADNDTAEELFERLLVLREENEGRLAASTVVSLYQLANTCWAKGDHAKCLKLCRTAMSREDEALRPDSDRLFWGMGYTVEKMLACSLHQEAEPIARRIVAAYDSMVGRGDIQTSEPIQLLGKVLEAKADYTGAESYYQEALKIRQMILGENDPLTLESQNDVMRISVLKGD